MYVLYNFVLQYWTVDGTGKMSVTDIPTQMLTTYIQNDIQHWQLNRDTYRRLTTQNIKCTYFVNLSQRTVVLVHKQVNNTSVTFACC